MSHGALTPSQACYITSRAADTPAHSPQHRQTDTMTSGLWNYSISHQEHSGILTGVPMVTEPDVTSDTTSNSSDAMAGQDEDQKYREFYLRAQFITGLFCYPTVCLFGLTGNILSIVVLCQRKMKSSTNTFLVALAISDGIKLINDS